MPDNNEAAERERARQRIAKLMALANNEGAAENEAETALRMAESLMRKFGIEAAEADAAGTASPLQWSAAIVPAGVPVPLRDLPLWLNATWCAVGEFTDCKTTYTKHPTQGACYVFRGEVSDVAFAAYLAAYLRDYARDAAARFNGTRTEREAFRKGFARRVCERMRQSLRERRAAMQATDTTGRALIVLDRKIALRDAEFGADDGGQRVTRVRGDADAMAAGIKAGDRAGLARPVGVAEAPRAIKG